MTENICNFCNATFCNKSNLYNHQKTAKFCLEIQKKNIELELADKNFNCEYCNRQFNRKDNLNRHLMNCKQKEEKENSIKNKIIEKFKIENDKLKLKNIKLEEQLKELIKLKFIEEQYSKLEERYINLEQKYADLVNKTTSIVDKTAELVDKTNENVKAMENVSLKAIDKAGNHYSNNSKNYIQNLLPLTDDYIREQSKHLELKHVRDKTKSLAYFANEYSFKDRIVCTDVARRSFIFKDENGNIIKDPKGVCITKKFIELNRDPLVKLLKKYGSLFYEDNCPFEYKDKEEIDECLYAIQRGDQPQNSYNYEKFQRIFTTCISKLVYVKDAKDGISQEDNNTNEVHIVSKGNKMIASEVPWIAEIIEESGVKEDKSMSIDEVKLYEDENEECYEEENYDDSDEDFGEDPRILRQKEMEMYEEAGVDFFNPFKLVNGICKE